MSEHRLAGLEPDNLLAVMALLGLLRALDEARPEWRARASWDTARGAIRPVLACAADVTKWEIARAATDGAAALAPMFDFGRRRDLDHAPAEASALWEKLEESGDERAIALFAALLPDGRYSEADILRTPFCFLFGQGHQHFLDRLADIPNARGASRSAPKLDLAAPERIGDALFRRWKREDPTDGFRWDPAEDRRYALRADDPSGDPAGQEYGACRLAAIGLLALPGRLVRLVGRGAEARYLNAMTKYDGGDIVFEWPIWTRPARLGWITARLAAGASAPSGDIAVWHQARRISVGKFFNVTAATALGS